MCDHCGCHEYPAIAELTTDHDAILSLAWQVAKATHDGAPADHAARAELLALLDVHVTKEETGLYPLLLEQGDLSHDAANTLEDEHRTLRDALAHDAFGRRDYYALAAHIEEEEMELFPAAMFAFDDDEWDRLAAAHRRAGAVATPLVSTGA